MILRSNHSPSILLVYPSCFYSPNQIERVQIKTSQLWLASFLNQFFPVTYADFELEIGRPDTEIQIRRFKRKVREYLASHEFDILAISCWTSLAYQATITTARICRELYPNKIIVVGGYHPSARPLEFMTGEHLFDYVVVREGELALKDIAECSRDGERPARPQLITGATVTQDMFVEYDWGLVNSLVKRHFPEGINNFYIYLSRGCPFGCSFCMEPIKERVWRAFTPEQAIIQIQKAVSLFKLYAVAISDACFGMQPTWRKGFLRRFAALDPDFWIIFETRPEFLDAEDIKLLAGKRVEIQFGVESCSPQMLRIMKKTRQPDRFLERFSEISLLLSKNRILHRANIIFNHPGETRKTLEETFTFIDHKLERSDSYLMWVMHDFMHFPGCDIDVHQTEYEKRYGCRFISGDWWKRSVDQFKASMEFIPSHELQGDNINLWQTMLEKRKERMKECLAPEAFQFAALKYFPEWWNDPRHMHD